MLNQIALYNNTFYIITILIWLKTFCKLSANKKNYEKKFQMCMSETVSLSMKKPDVMTNKTVIKQNIGQIPEHQMTSVLLL